MAPYFSPVSWCEEHVPFRKIPRDWRGREHLHVGRKLWYLQCTASGSTVFDQRRSSPRLQEALFLTREDSSPHVTTCISGKVLESLCQRSLQAYLNIRYVSQRGNGMEKSSSALFSCLSTKQSKQMSLDKWKSIRLKRPLSFNWFKLSG